MMLNGPSGPLWGERAAKQPLEPQYPLAEIFNEQKPFPEDLHIR